MNHKMINKAVASIKNALPDLFTYFYNIDEVIKHCKKLISNGNGIKR